MRLTLFLLPPLAALATAAPLALAAQSADRTAEDVASFETGVICAPPSVGEAPAPDTVAGTTHLIAEEPPFVSTRNRVPAVLGIGFGAKTMVDDPNGLSEVTITISHPPMGDAGTTSQSFQSSISGIDPSLTFYQFDYTYELLPGTWRMRAEKDGRVIYKTSFEVVPPRMIPELASVCGFESLLS